MDDDIDHAFFVICQESTKRAGEQKKLLERRNVKNYILDASSKGHFSTSAVISDEVRDELRRAGFFVTCHKIGDATISWEKPPK